MIRFKVPILLVVFNRPDKTKTLIEVLRVLRPEIIYVTGDGPRKNNSDDLIKCELVKREIGKIDWDCCVHTNYSIFNRGCKEGVSSGINWFFSQVDYGIILEDDIKPNFSFFRFCEELLIRFKDDNSIGMISGCNPVADLIDFNEKSYSFSSYANIWGWATWKRAWISYDLSMNNWLIWRSDELNFRKLSRLRYFSIYWKDIINSVYSGKIDTWDFQWFFSLWVSGQLCVVPKYNLVENLGFDHDATHTDGEIPNYLLKNIPKDIGINLCHPTFVKQNIELDNAISETVFKISLFTVIKNKIHRTKFLGTILVKFRRKVQRMIQLKRRLKL